ncbi:hypothetical protein M4D58_03270 [Brevibacillus borstelensis]|uniref:hypothetical protein n=1 Tax=Brevibacillus borstelensis TaxID=45462 RepID=UPI0020404821|nr:hypothetical protein [Brevibacillus borstelensis]
MGAFKASVIPDKSDKLVDHCDDCGSPIYSGQEVWKIGGNLYCNTDCFKTAINAVQPMRI